MSNRIIVAVAGLVVLLLLCVALLFFVLRGRNQSGPIDLTVPAAENVPLPTVLSTLRPEGDDGQSGGVEEPTPIPTPQIVVTAGSEDAGFDLEAMPSLDELLAKYPDLAGLLTNLNLEDEAQLRQIYRQLLALYEAEGLEGLQVFLSESGLIEALNLDSAYVDFILAYEEGGLVAAEALARQRGLITDDNQLRVVLVLDSDDVSVIAEQLALLEATVLHQAGPEVEIGIPLTRIALLGSSEDALIEFVQLANTEHVIGVQIPVQTHPAGLPIFDQGPAITGASEWQAAGINGNGVKVGIIDPDGFYGFLDLLGNELPTADHVFLPTSDNPQDISFYTGGHGTACAEIIHEMAPGADLYLAYAPTDLAFYDAVEWMVAQGVQIISYSAGMIIGPTDGSSEDAQLVNWVADQGVLWINASGNYAQAHLSMTFTDEDNDGWHEFPDGEEVMPFNPDTTDSYVGLGLTWNDSWGGASEDYDIYVLADTGDDYEMLASERTAQSGRAADLPFEAIDLIFDDYDTYYLAIQADRITYPAEFNLLGYAVTFGYSMPAGSLTVPADAQQSFSVGATYWQDDELEYFSSQGPTSDGRGKPEISAPDGVDSATYGEFYGTSAATPHVAGAAALVWSAYPDATANEVRDYLLANVLDLGPAGTDNGYGYGRLEMPAAPDVDNPQPEPPAGDSPQATIDSVRQEHNIYNNNQKGMAIYVTFSVNYFLNRPGTLLATFNDRLSGQPLTDNNGNFTTPAGQVASQKSFQAPYDTTQYTDFALFLPYNELDLPLGDYKLAFQLTILDDNTGQTLAISDPINFSYTQNQATLARATINDLAFKYDAEQDGEIGLEIIIDFEALNLRGQGGQAVAYFYFGDESNRPLLDFNDRYVTPYGTVGTGRTFTPATNNATYDDFNLFIPYSELHMAPGAYNLKFYVVIWTNNGTALTTSEWIYFLYVQD